MPYRTRPIIFKGRQEGLKKAIFEYDKPKHAAQFKTTFKKLALFVEKEYNSGKSSGHIFRELSDVTVTLR